MNNYDIEAFQEHEEKIMAAWGIIIFCIMIIFVIIYFMWSKKQDIEIEKYRIDHGIYNSSIEDK